MRSKEAIAQADELRPNALGEKQKLDWLLELEAEGGEMMALGGGADIEEGRPYPSGYVSSVSAEALTADRSRPVPQPGSAEPMPEGEARRVVAPHKVNCPEEAGEWEEEPPLLLPPPRDRVYVLYLAAMIDFYNGEMGLYANDYALYNQEMASVRAWWRRKHEPRPKRNWKV